MMRDVDRANLRELAVVARITSAFGLLVACGVVLYCAQASETDAARLEAHREHQAQVTDEAWRRVRASRVRMAAAHQAFRDSVALAHRSRPAVTRAIARADSAHAAVTATRDIAAAGDTTSYVRVTRRGEGREHRVPAFLIDLVVVHRVALDSAVRQLARQDAALRAAAAALAIDSVAIANCDSLVRSLQRERDLATQAVGAAARAGHRTGVRDGVIVSALVALLGAFLW